MRSNRLAAAAVCLLSGAVLTAACTQSSTAAPETDEQSSVEDDGGPAAEAMDDGDGATEGERDPRATPGGGIYLPANAYINCRARGLGADACAAACSAVGAACGPIAAHPFKRGQGTGQLTYCKNGSPTFTCTYTFTSGDGCVRFVTPLGSIWRCIYPGGQ